ncbi:hypothetical protein CHL78_010920 [Romboutsia weinsteinii]|uniref:Uncharacterized protein n=1 Tax=Romboutsia weinsteinii TaxID=2020949 RepID=A0A371J2M9_9FIRM|nr:hypothetical protein CHL78_010920 [Romboutsia weinsteinii]
MKKYYNLLGLHINDVKEFFDNKNIHYSIKTIQDRKDQDRLTVPKVIKISEIDNNVELIMTYFSDSLN